jgi:hypothetical protein
VIGKRLSAPTVAPMSQRRLFAATEGFCRGDGCAKLLTLRIVDICSRGFYFGRSVPASGLPASILADFLKALRAYRCECGDTDTINSGSNITLF